ncbi:cytochrome-c oxidase, cbb3-type subunit III [Limnobacter humi]|uniref:Cbb3-type cytochrome c oxidase subunit n=1 Tax=Limnobacter humi TaxID=1778671 RepID=A0ABT1WDH6_9BURK|nr:cytochrome-c oxidase, cbb3-type subunit III [Limnobacter humi]MCQ8895571.1 cytochrome-c oxidase, cbb3-type subunit III [Limnobacter humi]
MNDFQIKAVAWAVAAVTVLSILACGVFLFSQAKKKLKVSLDVQSNSTGHVWDEDLQELNNPMPRWWMGLFVLTLLFAAGYLAWYPGLVVVEGSSKWTSKDEYTRERAAVEAKAAPLFAEFAQLSLEDMAKHPKAMDMGQRIFLNNCAQCHGSDGRGSKGFPNLTDRDWLYGGEPETIRVSIEQGRNGAMPSMAAAVGSSEDQRAVAQYVLSLSGRENDSLRAQLGRAKFKEICAACHGADGKGNPALGAPNLTDRVWLYGGSEKVILETIRNGRENHMPSHATILTPEQIRVVASYVWRFSHQE